MSLFLTMNMILKRLLVIRLPLVKFSFNFVPVMLCAIILGTRYTVLLEALSDILGCLLFPRGMFFIGYTISSMVVGLIYGSILYPRGSAVSCKELLPKLVISMILVAVLVSIGLNTMFTFYTTKIPIMVLLPVRVTKQVLTVPIKIAVMYYTVKFLENKLNKMMC